MSALTPGQLLGQRFTLLRFLGKGGMAEIWLVRDDELDRKLAAKIAPPGAPEDRVALLRREWRNVRRLAHPNIVRVFDFHRDGEIAFITMEPIEGEDLGRLRGSPPAEIVRALLPIADALEYAHRLGVVHRDLKVSNVVSDAEGRPRLLDFGIAGLLEGPTDGLRLAGGGSPYSASPEQLAGEEPRPADDVYALGVLLYELISGRPPFWPEVTEDRVRHEPPPKMGSPHPIPGRLQTLVERMLSKHARERPADMAQVKAELEEVQRELAAGSIASRPPEKEITLTPPPRATAIRPVEVPGLPGRARSHSASARERRRVWYSLLAIAVPTLLAIAVFVALPRWAQKLQSKPVESGSESRSDGSESTLLPAPARATEQEPRERAELRRRAEEAGRRSDELHGMLAAMGAAEWGKEAFDSASARLAAGAEQLDAGSYAEAEASYGRATELCESALDRSREVLRQALADGQRALDAGDSGMAAAAFTLARRIAADNRTAEIGLRRAGVLDQVVALINAGRRLEREGNLEGAGREYVQAAALDPLSRRAQDSLARVQTRISDHAFARSMSDGLAALEKGEFDVARAALREADGMRPGSPAVAEALTQLEETVKLDAISEHRERAQQLEHEEQWRSAADQYGAVLELDPSIAFAQNGKERCLTRAALAERMEFHLAHPDRLSADAVLQEADALLEEATEIEPSGPRHGEQLRRLARLLENASAPVRVILESDDETEVTVYRVGRLGTFTRRALELRPGRYTVVGSRRGYRDVRHELVVVAGEEPDPLIVRCEEEI
jgi:serine/threonine protein kinase